MELRRRAFLFSGLAWSAAIATGADDRPAAELPSWRPGPTRRRLVDFVRRTSTAGSADFVPESQRIAVFDNDGALWCEQPLYVQLAFALDRVRALAPQHPEWRTTQPFQAALEGDLTTLGAAGTEGIMKLVAATHSGMTPEQFDEIARDWLATARHPRFDRPYTQCVYQPMLELLTYLRANGFRTYIVSGGGVAFLRAFAQEAYGIPPEQVVGTRIELAYEEVNGEPRLVRKPAIDFVDDKAGKPVGIQQHLGVKPIVAVGNSDGDYEMLRYVTAGAGPRLGVLVHHTDATREYAYDRESHVGRLDRALTEAPQRNWLVVDMAQDWARIFPRQG